jgi:Cdc6-like AAA superfamily ATPase
VAQDVKLPLIVYLQSAGTYDPNGQLAHRVADIVNGLQEGVKVDASNDAGAAIRVSIIEHDGSAPYGQLWGTGDMPGDERKWQIDTEFYRARRVRFSLESYTCYILGIILFEHLYRQETGKEFRVIRPVDYDSFNDFVWTGGFPMTVTEQVNDFLFYQIDDSLRSLLSDIDQFRSAGSHEWRTLQKNQRDVSAILRRYRLPIPNINQTVNSVFTKWDQGLVQSIADEFNRGDDDAIRNLVDTLAGSAHPMARELLKGIADATMLDPEDKDYAQKAVEEVERAKRGDSQYDASRSIQEDVFTPEIIGNEGKLDTFTDTSTPAFAVLDGSSGETGIPPSVLEAAEDYANKVYRTYSPTEEGIGLTQWLHKEGDQAQAQLLKAIINEAMVSDLPFAEAFLSLLEALRPSEVAMAHLISGLSGREDIHDGDKQRIRIGLGQVAGDAATYMAAANPGEPESARTGRFGVHSDAGVPVDALDFEQYAEAFADIAADSETRTPFTVGIYARWGRGKTALMNYIAGRLKEGPKRTRWWQAITNRYSASTSYANKDAPELECVPIYINAWDLARTDNVWAELYSRMMDTTAQTLTVYERLLFKFRFLKRRSSSRFWWGVTLIIMAVTLGFFLWDARYAIGLLTGTGDASSLSWETLTATANQAADTVTIRATQSKPAELPETLVDWSWLPSVWSLLTAAAAFLTAAISTIVKYSSAISSLVFRDYRKTGGNARPGTQQASIDTIKHANNALKATAGDRRFVIFVDDIDRCPPRKMLEVIETVQLFRSDQFFVFLAMDARVVRQALGLQYKFVHADRNDKGRYPVADMGRQYLEKVIQVPFNLPALTPDQRLSLNESLVESYEPAMPDETDVPLSPSSAEYTGDGELPPESGENIPMQSTAQTVGSAKDSEPSGEVDNDLGMARGDIAGASPETKPVRSRLSVKEAEVIRTILRIPEYDISPRLWKRFINIYMLARHLYIQQKQRSGATVSSPPASIAKWLALAVMLPYEANALLEWLSDDNNSDPFDTSYGVFNKDGTFIHLNTNPDTGQMVGRMPEQGSRFEGLSACQLNLFGRLFLSIEIDLAELATVRHITDCFNLVMD